MRARPLGRGLEVVLGLAQGSAVREELSGARAPRGTGCECGFSSCRGLIREGSLHARWWDSGRRGRGAGTSQPGPWAHATQCAGGTERLLQGPEGRAEQRWADAGQQWSVLSIAKFVRNPGFQTAGPLWQWAMGLALESSLSRAGAALAREWPGRVRDAGARASARTSTSASKGCLSQGCKLQKTGV